MKPHDLGRERGEHLNLTHQEVVPKMREHGLTWAEIAKALRIGKGTAYSYRSPEAREAYLGVMCEKQLQYRRLNPEKVRKSMEKFREKHPNYDDSRPNLRIELMHYLGGKCSMCGTDDIRVLQLNHLMGGGKKDFERYRSEYHLYKAILSGEEPKSNFNVLCANCNLVYEYKQGRRGRSIKPLPPRTDPSYFKQYHLNKTNEFNLRKRMEIIDLFGGRCTKCGIVDWRVLQLHHSDGSKKEKGHHKSGCYLYQAILSGKVSQDGLELVCANCNVVYEYELGRRKTLR